MTDPVDRRAAETAVAQKEARHSLRESVDALVNILQDEAKSATKYPIAIEVEARNVVVVSYRKEMFGNRIRKEIAELHVKGDAGDECYVVFGEGIILPAEFEHGIAYDFDEASEFVMCATIECMAQSFAAGCKIVAQAKPKICPATRIDYLELAQLFRAYAASLPIDLSYQGFDGELASLPGKYAPPAGALLIARDESGAALGCVAMRPLDEPGVCEMKRLYVAPEGRGMGLGRALAQAIIIAARAAGYQGMRLDTLSHMTEAQALYRALGFTEIGAYYDTPIENTVFMSLKL